MVEVYTGGSDSGADSDGGDDSPLPRVVNQGEAPAVMVPQEVAQQGGRAAPRGTSIPMGTNSKTQRRPSSATTRRKNQGAEATAVDPNAMDKNGETALYVAAQEGHAEVVRVLLDTLAAGQLELETARRSFLDR